jgi:hypothetical protein
MDPAYVITHIVNLESELYSFVQVLDGILITFQD